MLQEQRATRVTLEIRALQERPDRPALQALRALQDQLVPQVILDPLAQRDRQETLEIRAPQEEQDRPALQDRRVPLVPQDRPEPPVQLAEQALQERLVLDILATLVRQELLEELAIQDRQDQLDLRATLELQATRDLPETRVQPEPRV